MIIQFFLSLFAMVAVGYPLWTRFQAIPAWSLNPAELALNIFPFLGLLMFSLLWLHSLCGVFEEWLRKYIAFDMFVHITATIILFCLVLHPLLLLMGFNFNLGDIYGTYDKTYIYLAIFAWCLLITYDIGKALKGYNNFFVKHWQAILAISNIGFLLTFFHSLNLGSDLQSGPLRIVWIFYGITAMLAITYTYAIKPFWKASSR